MFCAQLNLKIFAWIICLLIVTLGTVTKKGKLNKPMEKPEINKPAYCC